MTQIGLITLRRYQESLAFKGAELLSDNNMCYYAMEVRTGKTITALVAAKHFFEPWSYPDLAPVMLFVTKKKAITSIIDDYRQLAGFDGLGFKIEVVNYESLHKVCRHRYDIIVCDEAHSLGAYPKPTNRTIRLRELVGQSPVIFLSGTPNPESYSQLYHQLWITGDFSPFHGYKNFYNFARDFVYVRQRKMHGRLINDYSKANEAKIRDWTSHLFLSFSQRKAGFKSGVTEHIRYISAPIGLLDLYNEMKNNAIITTPRGNVAIADNGAAFLSKLHQLAGGTVIATSDNGAVKGEIISAFKAQYIDANFYKRGLKIAIFYTYIAEGNLLRMYFENHTDNPEEFQAGHGNLVFISHVKSGGEGVKLASADAIIFYNISYSSKDYWQARSRSQYLERAETNVYWILTADTVHGEVLKMVMNKKDFTLGYYRRKYGREPLYSAPNGGGTEATKQDNQPSAQRGLFGV